MQGQPPLKRSQSVKTTMSRKKRLIKNALARARRRGAVVKKKVVRVPAEVVEQIIEALEKDKP